MAINGAGFERAGVLATEALSLFTTLGDTSGRAEALFMLGTVELYSARSPGRHGEGVASFRLALVLAEG